MKKQTYVCGLDVHKDSIYAAIYNGKDCNEVQVFGTFTDQLNQLVQRLEQNSVKRVAFESTAIYWAYREKIQKPMIYSTAGKLPSICQHNQKSPPCNVHSSKSPVDLQYPLRLAAGRMITSFVVRSTNMFNNIYKM